MILHQRLELLGTIAGDDLRIEAVESAAEVLPLAQDRDPGEAGLETIEDQLLEQGPVVRLGHAPVGVVIGDIERIDARPGAAGLAVGMVDEARRLVHAFV